MKAHRFLIAAALTATTLPGWALHAGEVRIYVCEQGSCDNGQGAARSTVTKVLYEGLWRNGHSVPGETYTLTHPVQPGKQYRATFAANGLQDSGDMVFGAGIRGRALPVFSGQYAHVDHPFAKMKVAVPKRGQLDDGMGMQYIGRFEYLPGKSTLNSILVMGTYIFFGTVVDTEDGTKETGLYIGNEQINGMAPQFYKANAGFLAKLQQKYQDDLQVAKVVFAERESSARWREALAVVGKITMALATGGASAAVTSLAGETAMNLVGGMMKGDDASLTVDDATNLALQRAAGEDTAAADQLRGILKR
jgi:hypothetical protein